VKAAFYTWKASFAKISSEFSLPMPKFTYTDYLEEVETRVGPQEKSYSITRPPALRDYAFARPPLLEVVAKINLSSLSAS